jgi:hypothetical protein
MKVAINSGFISLLSLLSLLGARVVPAAEPIVDGQEQARLLLSGKGFPVKDTESRSLISGSEASNSVALDAHEQARQMILGRATAKASAAVGAAADRMVEEDALEMARRMILGSHSKTNSTKARLASKAE